MAHAARRTRARHCAVRLLKRHVPPIVRWRDKHCAPPLQVVVPLDKKKVSPDSASLVEVRVRACIVCVRVFVCATAPA